MRILPVRPVGPMAILFSVFALMGGGDPFLAAECVDERRLLCILLGLLRMNIFYNLPDQRMGKTSNTRIMRRESLASDAGF